MNDVNAPKDFSKFWIVPLLALLIIGTLVPTVESFHPADAESHISATYSHSSLRLTIPYNMDHSGSGELSAQLLDPDNRVLAETQRHVEFQKGTGEWREQLQLRKAVPPDEIVWHRVRYTFHAEGGQAAMREEIESISQIIHTPVIHILGQQAYLAGGAAAVRVIVADSKDDTTPPNGGSLAIRLEAPNRKSQVLFTGRLNHRGTTEAQFHLPSGVTGSYELHYLVDTEIGSAEFTQPMRLEDKVAILLTTEKPIYQPGQTIHARVLALDRANHEAVDKRKLVFEVEDSRGNKVFKKVTRTDAFGVASAEFQLADEVNLGTYHLRALMGEGDAPTNTGQIAINVERYVLPKFKVAVDFSGSGKARHGYRPGDRVTGTVRANYFFGKPVGDAEISVKASSSDVSVFDVSSSSGRTDAEGNYQFALRLPAYFVGRSLDHGAAHVLIEATVKDSAGHAETRGEPIVVSASPLLITAVPEGGALIPNLENQVFILTSYPDGTPARADLIVHAGESEQKAASDEGGVAVVTLKARDQAEPVKIVARDKDGNQMSSSVSLETRSGSDQILLRPERAIYRTGDKIQVKVLSTKERGVAYVDVVKDGQTVLTRDVEIEHGQAELSLAATDEMAGTLDFNAYLFGADAHPVADHRLVFVQPADELKVEAAADGATYKPGQDARIRFRVTNSHGEGVSAVLGLQVVDEAVFALAEKQPGFAKIFFYLEQELMKPRYEIHSIGMEQIVEPGQESAAQHHDRAARALFSAMETVQPNQFQTEFGRTVPMDRYADYSQRYQQHFLEQTKRLAGTLAGAYAERPSGEKLERIFTQTARAGGADFRDAWGSELRLEPLRWAPKGFYSVTSAGPDKRFDTMDDDHVYLQVRRRNLAGAPKDGPSELDVKIEHDHGPMNGRAEIVGVVLDQRGAALEKIKIVLLAVASGKERTAWTDSNGKFTLTALSPGEYRLTAKSGAQNLSRTLKLEPRDQVACSLLLRNPQPAALSPDGRTELVVLEPGKVDFPVPIRVGVIGGVAGGVMGGMLEDRFAFRAALPSAAPMKAQNSAVLVEAKAEAIEGSPRTRSYFPEALYINPEIITDKDGRASITIPLADSITTWRMAMLASTTHGALGSGTSSVKVFRISLSIWTCRSP